LWVTCPRRLLSLSVLTPGAPLIVTSAVHEE
jgi:hypothetical protein